VNLSLLPFHCVRAAKISTTRSQGDALGGPARAAKSALPATAPTIDRDRERMRGWIALALIGLLAAVLLAAFVGLLTTTISAHDLKELSPVFLSPLIALVSAATGFYFGGAKR
jgi:hypothetical protein